MKAFFSKIGLNCGSYDSKSESARISKAGRLVESDEEWHTGATDEKGYHHLYEHEGLYFRDGLHCIDLMLVYRDVQFNLSITKRIWQASYQKKINDYIDELQKNGLKVEMESLKDEKNVPIYFIKLHAPLPILMKKAEEMRLKLPFAIQSSDSNSFSNQGFFLFGASYHLLDPGEMDNNINTRNEKYLMAPFSRHHVDKFLGHGECFDTVDRIRIVQRILDETRFSEKKTDLGIKTLLYQKVFQEAYPLHDGPLDSDGVTDQQPHENDRQRLRVAWATFRKFFKYQPINSIRSYFGATIGIYFTWLGFCVQMLLPAAIVGILILAYGISMSSTGLYPPINEICNHGNSSRFVMCPSCDKKCWYWRLSDICPTAKITAWLDNDLTVLFAIFMSLWSTVLTEFWKRRQTKLAFEWQTYNIEKEDEPSRPEYIAALSSVRRHIVTGKPEQYIPTATLYRRYAVVLSTVVFMVTLSLAAVVAVVIYRGAVYTVLITSGRLGFGGETRIITDVTAGLLNLVAINVFGLVYRRVAQVLTDWENPRTQSGWENSFTYKMFAYQFVNVYSSIFYIAFLKSELTVGTPGHFRRFGSRGKHGFRLESCPPSGCIVELCIQLAVIMVGQQLFQNIAEMLKPFATKWRNTRKRKLYLNTLVQWQQDYCLAAGDDVLFWEYLEIVLQLGFVMMFSVAFPLAPLFALINGLLEIRLDAIKYIFSQRRPSPKMSAGIGAWQLILQHLSEFAVLINALVVGFTTEFIPKLVYRQSYSPDGTLNGYIDNSLSFYNTSLFPEFERPDISYHNNRSKINYEPKLCRYRGYYELGSNQEHSLQFWHVMAVRFAFVSGFYYTICLLKKILEWIIPDEKEEIKLRRIKTVYIIKELFKEETEKETVHAA